MSASECTFFLLSLWLFIVGLTFGIPESGKTMPEASSANERRERLARRRKKCTNTKARKEAEGVSLDEYNINMDSHYISPRESQKSDATGKLRKERERGGTNHTAPDKIHLFDTSRNL